MAEAVERDPSAPAGGPPAQAEPAQGRAAQGRPPAQGPPAGGPLAGRGLPVAGLLIGIWAVLPPYVGPALATEPRVEFADHVVPGVVVIALSLAALAAGARAARPSTPMFVAGLVVVLAAVWMVATHVPLLAQAARDPQVSYFTAGYHTAPGLAVAALGVVWVARNWGDSTDEDERATPG